jgi:sporulation protein YabP
MQELNQKPHNLVLENRKKLSLSGVKDVKGFNEEVVSLSTSMGDLYIKGEKLHISKLDLDCGEVDIDGVVHSMQYAETRNNKGLMQRIFR